MGDSLLKKGSLRRTGIYLNGDCEIVYREDAVMESVSEIDELLASKLNLDKKYGSLEEALYSVKLAGYRLNIDEAFDSLKPGSIAENEAQKAFVNTVRTRNFAAQYDIGECNIRRVWEILASGLYNNGMDVMGKEYRRCEISSMACGCKAAGTEKISEMMYELFSYMDERCKGVPDASVMLFLFGYISPFPSGNELFARIWFMEWLGRHVSRKFDDVNISAALYLKRNNMEAHIANSLAYAKQVYGGGNVDLTGYVCCVTDSVLEALKCLDA